MPECFSPPKGTIGSSAMVASLMWTMPVSIALGDADAAGEVTGVHRTAQAVLGVVGDGDGLVVGVELHRAATTGPKNSPRAMSSSSAVTSVEHRPDGDVALRRSAQQGRGARRLTAGVDLALERLGPAGC